MEEPPASYTHWSSRNDPSGGRAKTQSRPRAHAFSACLSVWVIIRGHDACCVLRSPLGAIQNYTFIFIFSLLFSRLYFSRLFFRFFFRDFFSRLIFATFFFGDFFSRLIFATFFRDFFRDFFRAFLATITSPQAQKRTTRAKWLRLRRLRCYV